MGGAVVEVQRAGAEVGRLDGLAYDVRLSNPGALRVWEDDGYDVPRCLEGLHQRVHVGGGLVRGRAVVVHDLESGLVCLTLQLCGIGRLGRTRICILDSRKRNIGV